MADGRKQLGSQTYQQHLDELVEGGLITAETAKAALALTTPAPAASGRQAAAASDSGGDRARDTIRAPAGPASRGRHARGGAGPRAGGGPPDRARLPGHPPAVPLPSLRPARLSYLRRRCRRRRAARASPPHASRRRSPPAPSPSGRSCSPRRSVSPWASPPAGSRWGKRGRTPTSSRSGPTRRCAGGSWPTSTPRPRLSPWRAAWSPSGCSPRRSAAMSGLAVARLQGSAPAVAGRRGRRARGGGRRAGGTGPAQGHLARRARQRQRRGRRARLRRGVVRRVGRGADHRGRGVRDGRRRGSSPSAGEGVAGVEVVNLDTIDDRRSPVRGEPRSPGARSLAAALAPRLAPLGLPVRTSPAAARHSGGQPSAGPSRCHRGHGRAAHLGYPAGDPHAGRRARVALAGRRRAGRPRPRRSSRPELIFRRASDTFARGCRSPARGSFSLLWGSHVRRQDDLSGGRWGAVGRRRQGQAGRRARRAGRPGGSLPGRRQRRAHRRHRRDPIHPPPDPFRHPPPRRHLRGGQRRSARSRDLLRRAGPARRAGHRHRRAGSSSPIAPIWSSPITSCSTPRARRARSSAPRGGASARRTRTSTAGAASGSPISGIRNALARC